MISVVLTIIKLLVVPSVRGEWNSFQVPFGYALVLFLSRLFDTSIVCGTKPSSTGQIKRTTKACPINSHLLCAFFMAKNNLMVIILINTG